MKSLITRFIRNESGATAIEYGLIAAGLAIVIAAIFGTNGTVHQMMTTLFSDIANSVSSAGPS